MTPPAATKSELEAAAAAALDRAFDTESADEGAARLAQDASLRADLEAARVAAAEEAERPLEASHAEYIDSKTVPPAQRLRMPSQKLYVNEAIAFPQKGIPTVRGMRPVIEPPPMAPVIEHPAEAPFEEPAGIAAPTQSSSRLVLVVAAGLVTIGVASWLSLRDANGPRVEASAAPPPASSVPETPAPEHTTARPAETVTSPPAIDSYPLVEPPGLGAPSATPPASASAKPGRNPADFGGMQF